MARLKKISFSSYKKFEDKFSVEIRPITILIGKNSSGKSSVSKLIPMFEKAMSGKIKVPFLFENNGVVLGSAFSDISHNGNNVDLSFGVEYEDGLNIMAEFISKTGNKDYWIKDYSVVSNGKVYNLKQKKDQSSYSDSLEGKEYSPDTFRGLINENFFEDNGILYDSSYCISSDYIGPFRAFPQRVYCQHNTCLTSKIGVDGASAYDNLNVSSDLLTHVSAWYKKNFECELKINELDKGVFSVLLSKEDGIHDVNIADEGQGMSQVLPIVTRCFMRDELETIIVVEQPELHLHPASHEAVADLFAETAKKFNHRYVVETHSKNFLLEVRNLVADKSVPFSKDDVVIYYVREFAGNAVLDEITIDDNGDMSDWPEDVFNESYKLMKKLRRNSDN